MCDLCDVCSRVVVMVPYMVGAEVVLIVMCVLWFVLDVSMLRERECAAMLVWGTEELWLL